MSGDISGLTLNGQLVGITGKAFTAKVVVWLAVQTTAGESSTLETITDDDGNFSFELPAEPLRSAKLGAVLEGVLPLDLEPQGQPLNPGEILLFVDDFLPTHLRYAG